MIIVINEKIILRFFIIIVIPVLIGWFISPTVHAVWYYVTFDIYKHANESFRPENPIKPIPLEILFEPKITKLNMTWVNENLIPSTDTVGPQFPTLNNSKIILENITEDGKSFAKHLIVRGVPPHDWLYKENPCEYKIIKWCMLK